MAKRASSWWREGCDKHGMDKKTPAGSGIPDRRGDHGGSRHGRFLQRGLGPVGKEGARLARQGCGEPVLRSIDANGQQLCACRQAAFGRHHEFLFIQFLGQQGRDADRYGQEHRGDGGGCLRDPAFGAGRSASAFTPHDLFGDQRRRWLSRASYPGSAGHFYDSRALREGKGADGLDPRRHPAFARGAFECPRTAQARCTRDPGRTSDAGSAGDRAGSWRRSQSRYRRSASRQRCP